MSLGDDGYGTDYADDGPGAGRQTRTRLPEPASGDAYGRRAAGRPTKGMVTVLGVVVLLIAAIAFANRGGGGDASGDGSPGGEGTAAQPTAPTGERPVPGSGNGIASGFPKTEQGAQSAAANYAVALGGDGMFNADRRHQIVDTIYTAGAAAKLKGPQDRAYSARFLDKLGLDANGNPPKGMTFISRTIPVGTKVDSFEGDSAKVSVWYTGLIGMAGTGSTDPVRTDWKTWTFDLTWTGDDWKVVSDAQKNGPAPVPGDVPASTADDISKAVKDFGGFTYAR